MCHKSSKKVNAETLAGGSIIVSFVIGWGSFKEGP
jgi:hypothetical protein